MNSYHTPVMVKRCIESLNPHAGGVYVDATLGGGGHSLALLESCPEIRLYCFDQDEEAIHEAEKELAEFDDRVELIWKNFIRLRTELAFRQIKTIDGVIFDLGVSSHQIDAGFRGFSFDRDAELDMRMDRRQPVTAADAVNELTQAELSKIFWEYGEELSASRIARAIIKERDKRPILTTGELAHIVESVVGIGTRESLKSKVRIFQSLRIYINKELEYLAPVLKDAINILKPGGRIVVLSYHSLEDRVVKNTFRAAANGCQCPPQAMKCSCGAEKRLKLLTGKPVQADQEEIGRNARSRSVRMRSAEKIREES